MPRRVGAWGLILALSIALVGCEEATAPRLLIAVRAEAPIESLEVLTKQYFVDGSVLLHDRALLQLPSGRSGYLTSESGEPLRVMIDLPESGRYAIHFVGILEGTALLERPTALTATTCYSVENEVIDQEVRLGIINTLVDEDGDTFPEDLYRYCDARQLSGLACDLSCHDPSFNALLDCNPLPDFVPDPRCTSEVPPNTEWHPFTVDACADCLDQDCFGGDSPCLDADGDGFPGDVDCDDTDAAVFPGAEEVCGNGVDDNCLVDSEGCVDGDIPCDADRDGFLELVSPGCGDDCNDENAGVNPHAFEGCGSDPAQPDACPGCTQSGAEQIDDNCDGRVDEGCIPEDIDGDGIDAATDCDDCNSAVGPGFPEICGDGIDQDCSATAEEDGDLPCAANDFDGDGYEAQPMGSDCDDVDPHTFPEAPDRCGDGQAQNCVADTGCDAVVDGDGDFFGAGVGDCDDGDVEINPWAIELCDPVGTDEDCDGNVNEVDDISASMGCGFDPEIEAWYSIDYTSSPNHCGSCRHRCEIAPCISEGSECLAGVCSCHGGPGCGRGPESFCCPEDDQPAGCRDLTTPEDCGGCGESCREGEACQPDPMRCGLGHCMCEAEGAPCPDGPCWACCGDAGCVNVCESTQHCGRCGLNCTASDSPRGDLCWGETPGEASCFCGAIGTLCTGEQVCTDVLTPDAACGCADLNSDRSNCGSCGHTCGDSEECRAGSCVCLASDRACTGPETCCPGSGCSNTQTDTNNCGSCGNRCAWGESCVDGECRCGSSSGCNRATQDCCGGTCYTVGSDSAHCGDVGTGEGCTHSCAGGVPCIDGNCACGAGGDCGGGQTCCFGSYCAALSTDSNNCGSCGNECGTGETCISGVCGCGDCDDGNSCTEDRCVGSTCVYETLDADDDGYCASHCSDATSGSPGDCTNGDCDDGDAAINPGASERCSTSDDDDCDGNTNDAGAIGCSTYYRDADDDTYGVTSDTSCRCRTTTTYTATRGGDCNDANASINPGATEACNGVNDDCSTGTPDGDDVCSGLCCGSPPACRECCDDGDCSGTSVCTSYRCECPSGYTSCGGTCNCNTSGSDVCCGGSCFDGECCTDGDCTGASVSDCNTGTHTCFCAGVVCGGTCYVGGACCSNSDCTSPAAPNCNTTSHSCYCSGLVCGGTCIAGADCCDNSDCGGSDICCGNNCISGECCTNGDCPGSHFLCTSNTCSCESGWRDCAGDCDCPSSSTCCAGGNCVTGDECCTDSDCGGDNFICMDGYCLCDYLGGPDPCIMPWMECCWREGCCEGFCDGLGYCEWM